MNFHKKVTHTYSLFIAVAMMALTTAVTGQAQVSTEEPTLQVLTLEQAVDLALKNNKQLQMQANNSEVAQNNVYLGNAGFLPTVNLMGSGEYSSSSQELSIRTFQPEPPVLTFDEDGVKSKKAAVLIQADYVVISGLARKYSYSILKKKSTLENLKQEIAINETIVAVTGMFTQIASLQSREELLQETILVTTDRLAKIEDRKAFGQATGLDILKAKTYLNQDQSSLDEVALNKTNRIKQLNRWIGLPLDTLYRVNINYLLPEEADPKQVIANVKENNPNIKLAQSGVNIAEDQLGLAQSNLFPKLKVFANYGYAYQENDLQQLAELQNRGYTVGASLQYNIFNGSKTKREIQNATINIESQKIYSQDIEDQITTEALQELNTLAILRNQLEREMDNLDTFEETFNRTQERYSNGQATSLDLRDTQTALFNARVQVNDIKLKMVNSGMRLESLTGQLIKEDAENETIK
ncbi:TolC family protein [Fulvivirga sediminis]|uniref:TolC family protein n=1 Tax=Fulvivirga sediminis TaxID=2803949 RepID=A0A937FCQ1_9BACT|nr:TolC family protein [Fulvivirga sediminis]MBL3658784.1 TolC family protein [Fulvivirga sediminis]